LAAHRTVGELSRDLGEGRVSPVKVAEEFLKRIDAFNPKINCFITVLSDSALRAAEESERRCNEGARLSPIDGVPLAVKDLIYIEGVRCTAGSKILAKNVATYDSLVVRHLKAAGAVLVGTTNLHEFASGVTSVNPHYGAVRNPWDVRKISGGSSGGSAAAVSAGLSAAAIGTDTSGSIRIPASLCGVVGLKPTYGRISRAGIVPLSQSFDTVGTLSNSAWDAAALLRVMAGHEPEDVTSVEMPVPDFVSELATELPRLKVGVPRKYFFDLIDPVVHSEFSKFLDRLTSLGCEVRDCELKDIDKAPEIWAPIRRAEASAFHERWLASSPDQYGEDVRKTLELGAQIPAVRYIDAQNSRPLFAQGILRSMEGFDVLAVPTTPVVAPEVGEDKIAIGRKEVDVYSALSRLTLPFNVLGFPVISLPVGRAHGLPAGCQLISRPFEESTILRLASAYERKLGLFPAPPLAQHRS